MKSVGISLRYRRGSQLLTAGVQLGLHDLATAGVHESERRGGVCENLVGQHGVVCSLNVDLRLALLADVFKPASFHIGTPKAQPDGLRNSFRVETPFRSTGLRRPHRIATARLGDEGVVEGRTVSHEPKEDWSFLLDGRAELRITWRSDGCGDGGGCRFLEHPTADVSRATLVIRGTRR